jgi:predicted RNA methylase
MASKYDDLDAYTELEQELAADLARAFAPRGCVVVHHGANNAGLHSPGGKPDIELRDPTNKRLVLVEVTRRKSSAADGEFLAITDHLKRAIAAGGYDTYDMLYVSPRTSARMSTNIRDLWNRNRERDGERGCIVAIDFAGAEMLLEKLATSDPALYPPSRLGSLFARWQDAVDDARARQVVQATIFPEDHKLALDLANESAEIDAEREKQLKRQLERIEDKLRDLGITGNDANVTLVHLAFIRLFEERRQRRLGHPSRFTLEGFIKWREGAADMIKRRYGTRMVEGLLHEIAEDQDLRAAGLLRDGQGEPTRLHVALSDAQVEKHILPVLDQYDFHAGRVDVLGAVFETLARRSEKDTRIGQFFTPQQVVDFCANVVRLRPNDVVLDPAVGTGRFLIAAMERMLANADESSSSLVDAEASIRQRQLIGTDIDAWVATIAKMNMYIHGDGKSNVRQQNGLVLADSAVAGMSGLKDKIDVVLTNPPLGNTSFAVAADQWEQLGTGRDSDEQRLAYVKRLGVIELRAKERRELEQWEARLAESDELIQSLEGIPPEDRPPKKLANAYRTRTARQKRVGELEAALASGRVTLEPVGESRKGGALFVGAIAQYLKRERSLQQRIEWRGGHAAIIVDEAILNTPEYASTRAFIRNKFYVKAVVSLARESFKYLAHTDAKTSILVLARKPTDGVLQREPIFYAHAERVGYSATGSWVGDDLPQILLHYRLFTAAVLRAYSGAHLDQDACMKAVKKVPGFAHAFHARLNSPKVSERLDFYAARFRQREDELCEKHGPLQTLGDLIRPAKLEHPKPARTGQYPFAVVTRLGTVAPKGIQEVSYGANSLWTVRKGQLALSGIDLVKGAVGMADADVDGLVMSQEMYAYELKDGVDAELAYIALLLRSPTAREMLMGLVTGTSNRTRLETPEQILTLPIPPLPDRKIQRAQSKAVADAHRLRREAAATLDAIQASAQETWADENRPELPDPRSLPVVDAQLV